MAEDAAKLIDFIGSDYHII